MNSFSKNICEVISEPAGIKLSLETNPRIFERIFFKDSMLKFFPFGEIFLNDKQGVIVTNYVLLEGMKLSIKLGFPEDKDDNGNPIGGYMQHDYAWSEDQINDSVRDTEYISGINSMILISNSFMNDYINPTAYKQQPSTIARMIAEDVFKIQDPNKIHIDETNNDLNHIWYQGNRTHRHFLENTLVQKAYGSKIQGYDKTPFVSFINCNGEFYFCSYATLFNQTPIATYEQKLDINKVMNYYLIQDIHFAAGGVPLNKKVYNQDINRLEYTGGLNDEKYFAKETILLKDKILKINIATDKYPVYKQNTIQTSAVHNYGIYEEGDLDLYEAQNNFMYQNSCLAFRIEITILFNPKAISGKVIELKIKDFVNEDQYSPSLSGKWLIIDSEHHMDRDATIYSHLTLAKPSISFPKNWPYSANIIG